MFVVACRSELGILTSTALLNRIIRQVTSEALLQQMVYFLLGEEKEPETLATIAQSPLRHRLIEHCDHLSDEVIIPCCPTSFMVANEIYFKVLLPLVLLRIKIPLCALSIFKSANCHLPLSGSEFQ